MSASLVAVFIPLLFMGDIVGRLFREFAVTLSVAIAVSLVVSLTTTPTMCAKFLRPSKRDAKHNIFYRLSEWSFNPMLGGYTYALRWVLRYQPLTLTVTIGVAVPPTMVIPKGRCNSDPVPVSRAKGKPPSIAAIVVIMMGRKRSMQAS